MSSDQNTAESLVELAEAKALPRFQYMDAGTVDWIAANRPDFEQGAAPPVPNLHDALADALNRAASVPSSWYAERRVLDSVHGRRHALRTAVIGALLLARLNASIKDQLAVVIAAITHDGRRQDDKHDAGHGARASDWLADHRDVVADHFRTTFQPHDIMAMQVAVRLHELPYAQFSPRDHQDLRRAGLLVDALKTADALDRYRLPKLKWWPDTTLLRLPPPSNLVQLAYELVLESERTFLAGADSNAAVMRPMMERGLR